MNERQPLFGQRVTIALAIAAILAALSLFFLQSWPAAAFGLYLVPVLGGLAIPTRASKFLQTGAARGGLAECFYAIPRLFVHIIQFYGLGQRDAFYVSRGDNVPASTLYSVLGVLFTLTVYAVSRIGLGAVLGGLSSSLRKYLTRRLSGPAHRTKPKQRRVRRL